MILCQRLRKNTQECLLLLAINENGPEMGEIQNFFVIVLSDRKIFIFDFEKESSPAVEGQGI